jgi:hypothetical protein
MGLTKIISILAVAFWLCFDSVSAQSSGEASLSLVEKILTEIPFEYKGSTSSRALYFSSLFLGRPYKAGACGEGEHARFDRDPLVTFDFFDCTTYVETVLALAFTEEKGEDIADDFYDILLNIKYDKDLGICYKTRNHFVSLDWLPKQIQNGYLTDITLDLFPYAPALTRLISKKQWYASKKYGDIVRPDLDSVTLADEVLPELRALGEDMEDESGTLHYVPLYKFSDDAFIEKLIGLPDSIYLLNMVRADHKKIMIPVIAGHQGFLVNIGGKLFFRHSSYGGQVTDVPFIHYVEERKNDVAWPVLGFNINRINDKDAESCFR